MTKLLYIASPSFSGSTLLTFLLNAHPRIATMGELKWGAIDLATYRCSCRQLLIECSFWEAVSHSLRSQGLPFDLERPLTDFRVRGHYVGDRLARARVRGSSFERVRSGVLSVHPACRKSWPLVRSVNRAVIETIVRMKGADWFVDGSKDPVRLRHLLDTGDYDVRVVQLTRDARGVANSAMKNERRSVTFAAKEWVRTHEQIERLAARIGHEAIMRVRYEDLCTDVGRMMRDLFAFLGVEKDCDVSSYMSVEHHILGNKMRLREGAEIRLDEKWRQSLSAQHLAAVDCVAGALNHRYGYR